MRVLHVHSGNLYGGVETFLATLAREAPLAPDMVPSFALAFAGRLSRELADAGHTPRMTGAVQFRRPATVWRARRALAHVLSSGDYDLAVCHQAWPQALFGSTIRRAGLPLVLWVHTVGDGRHWLDRWAAMRPPDLVVCNSRFTAERHAPRFGATRTEWVYCPVRVSPARATDAQRDRTRALLDTPPGDVVIAQVGRLESLKGHRHTLEALARLADLDAWTYWIIGGPQRPSDEAYLGELVTQARRLGIEARVRFLGERSDVAALLGAADVYCQPNLEPEAFGLSLVEALGAGLPVVTSDLGGAREIVDASCGVLTPVGDVTAIATTLRSLIADAPRRARLGDAARARPDVLCNASRQMRRIADILSSAVRPGGLASSREVRAC